MSDPTEAIAEALAPDASVQDAPAPAVDEAADLAAAYDAAQGGERDDAGRFKAAGDAGDEAGEPAAEDEGADGVETPPETAPDPEPPSHLSADLKAVWKDAPENVREAMAGWSMDMVRRMTDQGRQLSAWRPMGDTISRYRDVFRGTDPVEGVGMLLEAQKRLDADPVGALLQIADMYGVRDKIGAAPAAPSGDTSALQRKIATLEAQLQKVGDPAQIDTRFNQMWAQRDAERVITDLVPTLPHFEAVQDHLPGFISIVQKMQPGTSNADVLKAAYDMAVNALPDVRAKVQREAAAKAANVTQLPDRTEAAKAAKRVNVTSHANGKSRPMTEEEAMAAAYDRAKAKG